MCQSVTVLKGNETYLIWNGSYRVYEGSVDSDSEIMLDSNMT